MKRKRMKITYYRKKGIGSGSSFIWDEIATREAYYSKSEALDLAEEMEGKLERGNLTYNSIDVEKFIISEEVFMNIYDSTFINEPEEK